MTGAGHVMICGLIGTNYTHGVAKSVTATLHNEAVIRDEIEQMWPPYWKLLKNIFALTS